MNILAQTFEKSFETRFKVKLRLRVREGRHVPAKQMVDKEADVVAWVEVIIRRASVGTYFIEQL